MTRTTRIFVGALVAMFVLYFIITEVAHGAVGINNELPFYGVLNDDKGKALSGTYDMVFKIYDAPTGGSVLWTGTHTSANGNAVSIDDGNFSVMLGSGTGNELTLDFNDDSYYLGITVGSDSEMTPRERLGASGYAINSDLLDGYHASDFLRNNSIFDIDVSTSSALFTVTQSGTGDFMNLYDGGETLLSYINSSGRFFMSSIETLIDETNVFAGALDVMSPDNSTFAGSIVVAGGSGLMLGGGNGIMLWQDTSMPTDLLLTAVGEFEGDDVRIVTPNALSIHANMDRTDSGDEQPAIEMNTNGIMRIYNLSSEPGDSPRLELSFAYGTEVTDGGLLVSDGGLAVTGGGITSEFDVEITDTFASFRASSLAGGPFSLESDASGNIIANPSDERLKQNIHTIDNALQMVLDLRGVRYEWKDAERFGSQTEVGFIAQEVQEVIPEVVRDNGEYLSLNTKNIVAVVVEAIKELYENVEEYMSRTERLEREVESLRAEIEILKGNDVESAPETEETENGEETVNTEEEVEDVPQQPVGDTESEVSGESVPEV